MPNPTKLINSAKRTLEIEISALQELQTRIDSSFTDACQCILKSTGKIIICGVGKSGHIGSKIAATLASTGTPAFYIHPTEAAHGDLGMVQCNDLVIAISYSGSSDELIALLPALKRKKIDIIALTGNPTSLLAQSAKIHINTHVAKEACPHNITPTASTTTTMVIGDMLAISLLEARGFTSDDFALSHPAGRLGKRLVLRVADIMHKAPHIPLVSPKLPVQQSLLIMTSHKLGMLGVISDEKQLIGIFTDGDLRRALESHSDWLHLPIEKIMTKSFFTLSPQALAAEALTELEEKKINGFFVTDDNKRPVGAFNMHDLLQSGIV